MKVEFWQNRNKLCVLFHLIPCQLPNQYDNLIQVYCVLDFLLAEVTNQLNQIKLK